MTRPIDNKPQQLVNTGLARPLAEAVVAPVTTGARVDMMDAKRDSVMTIVELSAYLKIAKSTLYKLAQEGKLPGQKVGRHWRFHREAVDRWLKAHPDTQRE